MHDSSRALGLPTRLHSLDGVRAAMMLLGIWLHGSSAYVTLPVDEFWPYRDRATTALLDPPWLVIHAFRIPLFFVVAGFFARLLWERVGPSGFIHHRARRILLPFLLAWLVLYVPISSGFVYAQHPGAGAMRAVWDHARHGRILDNMDPSHLWFLYFLLYFYLAVVVLGRVLPRALSSGAQERIEGRFRMALSSRWRPIIFAVPTCIALHFLPYGILDRGSGFAVAPQVLAAYGVFFGFGWLLYRQSDLLPGFRRYAWTQVGVALLLLPPGAVIGMASFRHSSLANHVGTIVIGSLVVWLLIFGVLGLFLRYLDQPSQAVRYVSDASYWVFLVHMPLMIWMQAFLATTPWPAVAKFLLLLTVTVPILFLSYHYLVRYTLIGETLHGPRLRPPTS
jgi:glucan biosynthesis protein C